MARRRGLTIHKAKRGGWYVTAGVYVLYCSHDWSYIKTFVRAQPILLKKDEE
jgi:hypothetical protein